MIKLTSEQKNLIALEECFNFDYEHKLSAYIKVIELLTLPQIKQLAEKHNASVIEWVDFHADDESTWPKNVGGYQPIETCKNQNKNPPGNE